MCVKRNIIYLLCPEQLVLKAFIYKSLEAFSRQILHKLEMADKSILFANPVLDPVLME